VLLSEVEVRRSAVVQTLARWIPLRFTGIAQQHPAVVVQGFQTADTKACGWGRLALDVVA